MYLPAKDQRAAMAGDVIADLFSGIWVESQELVKKLLEI